MRPDEHGPVDPSSRSTHRRGIVRVGLADVGSSGCPEALAAKVRSRRVWRRSGWRDFALGPLMDALDRVEFEGLDEEVVADELVRTRGTFGSDEAPAHPGLVAWSVEAYRNFLAARRTHLDADATRCPRPVRSGWVIVHPKTPPDHRGVHRYEQTCWGRRYESEDGSVREIWLLGLSVPGKRSPLVVTAAANVAAFGGPPRVLDRVRVVEFGARSPVAEQHADWTVEQVRLRAQELVWPRLQAIVDGTGRKPGRDCASCSEAADCVDVPRVDLLPDIVAVDGPIRDLSVTDLRIYRSCPARYHLQRQLRIRDVELVENEAIVIGRAVDADLRARHADGSQGPRCEAGQEPGEAIAALPEQSRRVASRMLEHHSAMCPFPDVDSYDGALPNQVVVYDERLRVVFIAEPDHLYPRWGGWVWRETKTSARRPFPDRSLLSQFPQLALALLMVASGALGRDVARSRVEFEQLRSDGCALEELDPGRQNVVAEARAVIGGLVAPLLADTEYQPTPGRDCLGCEVRRWCAPGSRHVAEQKGGPAA